MESSSSGITLYPYLASLNQAQLKAVIANPSTPLQILAGPGSGKTRVLTCRVAYLVQHYKYSPNEIVAVTFTNKSANEMRKRLQKLLGDKQADQLVLGTFHATCVKYLRRYGRLIDLSNNFVIADADDCKKIMSGILKNRKAALDEASMSLKEGVVLSEISKAKAKGEPPEAMAIRATQSKSASTNTLAVIADLYEEYQLALAEANSLDFDDLLLYALRLFKEAPRVVEDIRHILVDEFQDTNTTQYELLKRFAKAHKGVSVVGDPDQAIYGWRSAEIENLNKMTKDFPGVEAIYLEENYRSTGSILDAAHAIVSQDRQRIQKSLFTSHPKSTPVTLKVFGTPVIEASFISTEIKRLIAYSGGLLGYNDFAILLRYNALSRVIESSLQKDSIPNRIVGGHKFFERMEIKDLLAYLQLADNPGFNLNSDSSTQPAFVRVVNVPKRSIGDKTLTDILSTAKSMKISPMELCERVTDGEAIPTNIKPGVKKSLANFVGVIRKLRRAAERGTSVADLIKMIIEKVNYEEYLRTSQPDWDSRWENVKELVSPPSSFFLFLPRRISYSVTVAEEQARLSESKSGSTREERGFMPANSAAVEAMVNEAYQKGKGKEVKQERNLKKEKEEKRAYPMFRRRASGNNISDQECDTSSATGRSRSGSIAVNTKSILRRKGSVRTNETHDGVIELLSSDEEDQDVKPDIKPKKKIADIVKQSSVAYAPPDLVESLANAPDSLTPLAYFLQTSMLSTDTESGQDDASTPKVTITTVHAAKGLEWPVVFIPAVEQGTYPSYRCTEPHEIAEERRLLYVAMTRAQSFLFRMMGGEENNKEASEFLGDVMRNQPGLLATDQPNVDMVVRKHISAMLSRPAPDEEMTKDMIMKHVRIAPPLSTWDPPESSSWRSKSNRFARRDISKATRAAEYWASDVDEPPTTLPIAPQKKPPPPPVKSANRYIPPTMPFTFNTKEEKKEETSLDSLMSGGNKSLEMMAGLGLPADLPPNPVGPSTSAGGGLAGRGSLELARGKKRLGMGRPAPWGSKKPREN
ncbi:DNA helicase II/ATP-dependent DNA helicase PcrA [Cryptococcus gattii E566]|uniref:DNA 3'-5' helicase n=1 Tax=Cryptococcus gattii serotype B (strain WM276 / ATCC MYA-4071) TaxID=367775 RepID=E6R2P9_CRYGW|nr:ATP-dependent DNA helicase, putative [Cryptococcus gattii WM276]ADV20750.1 ATP-dependent DNA helicase, putative [Cryptococcus gattii WM276]KIY33279.1 DNA helicase II/ATP-dependent DNA helicase PcrA [Cryptococcus gattii E566]